MNNRFIVQLIVVITSALLGMFLYPWFRKTFARFIEILYMQTRDDRITEEEKVIPVEDEITSIIGKSKFNVGHSRTKAATDLESEKAIEKVSNFVPPTDSDPQMHDVEVYLEKVESLPEEEFEAEVEIEELAIERDAFQASGVSFDELITTGTILRKEEPTEIEKDAVGQILYENQSTKIVEQIAAKDEVTLAKVNSLIHLHMKKHNLETEQKNDLQEAQYFKDFDINNIFN